MLRKILVCLDGSTFAEELIPYAIDRATHFNSKIVLFKVINSNVSPYLFSLPGVAGQSVTSIPVITPTQLDSMIRGDEVETRLYLENVTTRLRKVGLDVEAVAWRRAAGDGIADAIVTYAAGNEVDLIMMAAHRFSFWKRIIYGSVTESVIRNTAVPVLVINPQSEMTNAGSLDEMPQASLTC